ncbi:PAS domain S-box protein [Candidatus Sumerlaeota bacterium]|nr:PAS domain S-box protein [Candidatus Sumerlaeota bacterium]
MSYDQPNHDPLLRDEAKEHASSHEIENKRFFLNDDRAVNDLIFRFDRKIRCLFINDAAAETIGLKPDVVIGKILTEFPIAQDQIDFWTRQLERTLEDKKSRRLQYETNTNGLSRYYEINVVPEEIENGAVQTLLIIGRETTLNPNEVARINEFQAYFRSMFAQLPAGAALLDINGCIVLTNAALQEMLGYSAREMGSLRFDDLSHRDERIHHHEQMQRLVQGAYNQYEMETRCLRSDGGIVWCRWLAISVRDSSGSLLQILLILTDITEQKQNKLALIEQENRLRLALDSAQMGIWEWNVGEDRLYWSDELKRMFGFENMDVELNLDDYYQFIYPPDLERVRGQVDDSLGTPGEYFNECRIVRADGNIRWTESRGRVILDTDGQPQKMIGATIDITERKEAELQLADHEEQLRIIFDNTADAIVLADVETQGFLLFNRAAHEQLGYTREEFSRLHLKDIEANHNEDAIKTNLDSVIQGRSHCFESLICCKSGEVRSFSVRINKIELNGAQYLLSVSHDITEDQKREAESRLLNATINQASVSIAIVDKQGKIEYVNPAFEKLTGFSLKEAKDATLSILQCNNFDQAFITEKWDRLHSGQVWKNTFEYRGKNGAAFIAETIVAPIRNAQHEIEKFVVMSTDISQEIELREQLRLAQKMEAVGQLAGGIAHDFNNLLQVISGYNDVALSDLPQDSPFRNALENVKVASGKAAQLVGQLLAFSRRQIIRADDLDLNESIETSLKMLNRLIGENIQLEFAPGQNVEKIYADPIQVEQVLINLCVNARDAMPQGGVISIETCSAVFDEEMCSHFPEAHPGHYAQLTVRDNGMGMETSTLERIFEPFFTTKELGRGTGLGLATVYGIVKQHEGIIQVHSEPGAGSVFKVYFPVAKHRKSSIQPLKTEKPVNGGETILIAEDESMIRDLIQGILESAGYHVLAVSNGRQAVDLFRKHDRPIDLLLLDACMPAMDGKETFETIKAIQPAIRAIFISGYSNTIISEEYLSQEDLILLEKPFNSEQLLQNVRKMLDARVQGES